MKLRVGMNPVILEVSDKTMDKADNKVTNEVLREIANDFASKLKTMSDSELKKIFSTFSIVNEEAIENPKVGMIVDLNPEGPAIIVKVNKKTANVVTANGGGFSVGLGGLIKSKVTLEEFKNMRTYNFYNKKESGAFYKVKGEGGRWFSCLLICSGSKYKLFKIDELNRFFTLDESSLDNGKSCILESNEVVK